MVLLSKNVAIFGRNLKNSPVLEIFVAILQLVAIFGVAITGGRL